LFGLFFAGNEAVAAKICHQLGGRFVWFWSFFLRMVFEVFLEAGFED
jgi:hypothetical protein